MAFFPKSPEKTVTRDRDNAKVNVNRLAARAVEAEKAVSARRGEAQQLAFDNADDAMLGKAEAALRGALDRQGTIGAASTEASKLLALLESQLAELLDKKQRAATASEVLAMADELIQASEATVTALTALAAITSRAGTFLFDARGLENFAISALTQVPEAVVYVTASLRDHAAACVRGDAPGSIRPVEVIVPIIEPERPTLTQVFTLNAVKFTDHDGVVRFVGKWNDVELPAHCAKRALRLSLAAPMTYPRRSELRGYGGGHPEKAWCVSLDHDPEPVGAEPAKAIEHDPRFTPVDRGQPYKLMVAR